MFKLYQYISHDTSAFGKATVCAIIIGIGDLVATFTDILWLIGDMSHGYHWYHSFVLIGLLCGLAIMAASFIWLNKAIKQFKSRKKNRSLQYLVNIKRFNNHNHVPTHSNVNSNIKIDYQSIEFED